MLTDDPDASPIRGSHRGGYLREEHSREVLFRGNHSRGGSFRGNHSRGGSFRGNHSRGGSFRGNNSRGGYFRGSHSRGGSFRGDYSRVGSFGGDSFRGDHCRGVSCEADNSRSRSVRGNHSRMGLLVEGCSRERYSEDGKFSQGSARGASCMQRGTFGQHGPSRMQERKYPIGLKKLEELMSEVPDFIVMSLVSMKSGFEQTIQGDYIGNLKMLALLRVLSRGSQANSCNTSMSGIYTKIFNDPFRSKIVMFLLELDDVTDLNKVQFLSVLLQLLNSYTSLMPHSAYDNVPKLMKPIKMLLINLEPDNMSLDEKKQFQEVSAGFTALTKQFAVRDVKTILGHPSNSRDERLKSLDAIEPHESFRSVEVEPCIEDIDIESAYVRRILPKGKFNNVDSYLDIHFRLLREDFMRPLREGIQDFKNKVHKTNSPVIVYSNCKVMHAEMREDKVLYKIKMSDTKQIFNPKRLIFGNLLCMSSDGFQSFVLASVAGKNDADLKKGIISVQFLTERGKMSKCSIIESKSFFIAYKYVLLALQRLNEGTLAFKEHIVDNLTDVAPPDYLLDNSLMKFTTLLDNPSEDGSEKYLLDKMEDDGSEDDGSEDDGLEDDCSENGLEVDVLTDKWPSEDDLGMDESQLRAFKSALTQKLALIQGPPGTGKTYLGKKIAQVLLRNSRIFDYSPILVVCYTNHALDQFLEGMLSFTKKVVRVGTCSKNEKIMQYSIKERVFEYGKNRLFPRHLFLRHVELKEELRRLYTKFEALNKTKRDILFNKGVIDAKTYKAKGVISEQIFAQLGNNVWDWLANSQDNPFKRGRRNAIQNKPPMNLAECPLNMNNWEDIAIQRRQEEEHRVIDDNLPRRLFEDVESPVRFAVTLEDLERRMNELKQQIGTTQTDTHGLSRLLERATMDYETAKYVVYLKPSGLQGRQTNLWSLPFEQRCSLYAEWKQNLLGTVEAEIVSVEPKVKEVQTKRNEVQDAKFLHVARHADVVGITTTGAAHYRAMLMDLSPKIVIVEEAGQILEAHVVASLSSSCEHLIMIGDHQQLKPSTNVYELATKYHLDLSLFERLINNGFPHHQLRQQHRMRPEISRLIVPAIYPGLRDAPVVLTLPRVLGMQRDLFFLCHVQPEKQNEDNSRSNAFEARFIAQLARYLLLQGYLPSQLTVLTPYLGQFFLLREEIRKLNVCNGIRICVVDNYQGEENDIILLSLVRSNSENNVGFLKTENRICVALSRAKRGFYIVGNLSQLCAASPLWEKMRVVLQKAQSVGDALPLVCQNHPQNTSEVSCAADFPRVSPEGGCGEKCVAQIPVCGHLCARLCHNDDKQHTVGVCSLPCDRTCERAHTCVALCYEECPPCAVVVQKTLPCGHTVNLKCRDESNKCVTIVEKTVPHCEHVVKVECFRMEESIVCEYPCELLLSCSHACQKRCHVLDDPLHEEVFCPQKCERLCESGHPCSLLCSELCRPCKFVVKKEFGCGHQAEVECGFHDCMTPVLKTIEVCGHQQRVPCSRDTSVNTTCRNKCDVRLGCGHQCVRTCHIGTDPEHMQYVCQSPCQSMREGCSTGTHKCPLKCFEDCSLCTVLVKKTISECGHETWIECHRTPERSDCASACHETLPCGHVCAGRCGHPCDPSACEQLVDTEQSCYVGHPLRLPCGQRHTLKKRAASQYCTHACKQQLQCGHDCLGSCKDCLSGRFHQSCAEKCERALLCGHVCRAACSRNCPPCQQKVRWRCVHNGWRGKCGQRWQPCKERCRPYCDHSVACGGLCGEACGCVACLLPCEKRLKCGHPCVGLCGDPCPTLCRICHSAQLTEFFLLGNEAEPDARFVLLPDCGHVIEHEGLSGWMAAEGDGEVQMKGCPRCKQPVYSCRRYKNLILANFKDVEKVKESSETSVTIHVGDVFSGCLETFEGEQLCMQDFFTFSSFKNSGLANAINIYRKGLGASQKNKPFFNLPSRHLLKFQKEFLFASVKLKKAFTSSPELVKELEALVVKVLIQKLCVSNQFMEESWNELRRVNAVRNIAVVRAMCVDTFITDRLSEMQSLLLMNRSFSPEADVKVADLLRECEAHKPTLQLTQAERVNIVRAMGSAAGHWYKCPRGHFYYIGDCGGANMRSTCPECGNAIGGESHRLATGNTPAPEMDGSAHPAWPV